MKRAYKKSIASLIAIFSITAWLSSTRIVLADSEMDYEAISCKVTEAKHKKSIGVYNEAYVAILGLPASEQDELMAELATVSKDVYTPINLDILKKINSIATNPNLNDFNELLDYIDVNIINEADKGYFKGEMDSWGRKLVYTKDVVNAIDAVQKACRDKTEQNIAYAKSMIDNVNNNESKKWLISQVPSSKEQGKIIITGNNKIKDGNGTYEFTYRILDANGRDVTNSILESEILTQTIGHSNLTVTLDPLTASGKVIGTFSDKDYSVQLILVNKKNGYVGSKNIQITSESTLKNMKIGEIRIADGSNKIKVNTQVAATIPVYVRDSNGNEIKDVSVMSNKLNIVSSNFYVKVSLGSSSDGNLQLTVSTKDMTVAGKVTLTVINVDTGDIWMQTLDVQK
jgi:hypothetical protein